MTNTYSSLERLERRIDHQAARIDALYRTLELHGILPRPFDVGRSDAFLDELDEVEDEPLSADRYEPAGRRPARLHVGSATGV